ncbi:MAG: hypothetical protein C5B59_13665 [Bacteroidetes bacterium]|nr:MAG: hypothetical protein C5B59_13665 [Bacteroidota bacterium]
MDSVKHPMKDRSESLRLLREGGNHVEASLREKEVTTTLRVSKDSLIHVSFRRIYKEWWLLEYSGLGIEQRQEIVRFDNLKEIFNV